jgi:UrcA family protein
MSKSLKSLVVTTIVFALGVPAIAAAAPLNELQGKAVKVSYADLNLENREGATVLYRRLQNAAKEACGVRSLQVEGSLSSHSAARSCYRSTLDAAVVKVDNAKVSSIHAS